LAVRRANCKATLVGEIREEEYMWRKAHEQANETIPAKKT